MIKNVIENNKGEIGLGLVTAAATVGAIIPNDGGHVLLDNITSNDFSSRIGSGDLNALFEKRHVIQTVCGLTRQIGHHVSQEVCLPINHLDQAKEQLQSFQIHTETIIHTLPFLQEFSVMLAVVGFISLLGYNIAHKKRGNRIFNENKNDFVLQPIPITNSFGNRIAS